MLKAETHNLFSPLNCQSTDLCIPKKIFHKRKLSQKSTQSQENLKVLGYWGFQQKSHSDHSREAKVSNFHLYLQSFQLPFQSPNFNNEDNSKDNRNLSKTFNMVSNKVTLKKLTLQKKKISKSIINKKTHYNHEARKGWIKKKHSETNKSSK